jgi:sulfate permease, SulP family
MHQFVIARCSTLPFAVGQVQDLGLILMAAMTTDIQRRLIGEPEAKVIGTAILASAMTTAMLGVCLYIAGRCCSTLCVCSLAVSTHVRFEVQHWGTS